MKRQIQTAWMEFAQWCSRPAWMAASPGKQRKRMRRTRCLRAELLEDRRLLTGPYAPAAGQPGSTAIHMDDPAFVGWATGWEDLVRGPQDINDPDGPAASFGAAENVLGKAAGNSFDVVSLGDGGRITLTFDGPIANGPGPDFAVFENGFNDTFLELAFVEVSSDGSHFFRFDAVSLTPPSPQVGGFGALNPTNLFNFAGKYRQGYGTPFDLQELADVSPLLDVNHVTHVRIIDVVGRVTAAPDNPSWSPSLDSLGNIVNDPYPTPFDSSGFDLDAIGVLNYRQDGHIVDFEDVGASLPALPNEGYWNGPDPNGVTQPGSDEDVVVVGAFESGGLRFNNIYSNDYGSWTGWAYSNTTDTTTPGYENQFSAYTGPGAAGSRTYAVAYRDVFDLYPPPTIERTAETQDMLFRSVMVTNTTYAALSMLNGDSFAKKFGGTSGDDPDWFLLTIEGKDADGDSMGTIEFYLADYRFENNELDYIIDQWTEVDLSSLASATTLEFVVTSSDVGTWGMNTPAYFAIDNLVLSQETLTIHIPVTQISEGAGPAAVMGTVSRSDADLSSPLVVDLVSSNTDKLIVPASVTIPAGQSSIEFPMDAVDNDIVDGNHIVTITASAAGYAPGNATLEVTDDDVPTLSLTVDPSQVSEADAPPTARLEDVGVRLAEESFWNGSDGTGGFQSDGLAFNNAYDATWGAWSGWSYSNVTDTTTPGYGNQFSAIAGQGALSSRTYAVGFAPAYGLLPTVTLTEATAGLAFESLQVTNTTYAALSMRDGDAFAKKFGGSDGTDPDWFLLTIEGFAEDGESVGTVDFYLADFRFEDPAENYIVDSWQQVDLSSLSGAMKLEFSLSSSDVGAWGMNTPAYFAVDQIVLSGDPAALGTVHRNLADLSSPLVVSLSSSDVREARVPDEVTIPAGQATAMFPIWAVDDAVVDGTQTVTIMATADGFVSGSAALDVLDDDPWLGLQLVVVGSPSAAGSNVLPTGIQTVSSGSTYYVEVWVQDRVPPGVGITGGYVDLNYTSGAADAVSVFNLDFDLVPGGAIDTAGVVQDLGGGIIAGGQGVSPQWARLGYVQFTAAELAQATFDLSAGSLEFSRYGAGEVPWDLVDFGQSVILDQIAGTRIDMAVVHEPSATDNFGQVTSLPDSVDWVHEWQSFWVEIWVSTPELTTIGVAESLVDLHYNSDYVTAMEIVHGPAFNVAPSGEIDDTRGLVSGIGGRTDLSSAGDDAYVLLARVRFASTGDDQVPVDASERNIGPYDMQMVLADGYGRLADGPTALAELGESPDTQLWAVMYDIDDNNQIDFGDFSFFAAAFGRTVSGNPESPYVWWADFDRSGRVDFGDLAFFAPNFGKTRESVQSGAQTLVFPPSFPNAWLAGLGGQGEGEAEGEGEAISQAASWELTAVGVPVSAEPDDSRNVPSLPWQIPRAVDEAHAALPTEPLNSFSWGTRTGRETQPGLVLPQESPVTLYSKSDEPDAAAEERRHQQFDDWEPLENLLTSLAEQPSKNALDAHNPHEAFFTRMGA